LTLPYFDASEGVTRTKPVIPLYKANSRALPQAFFKSANYLQAITIPYVSQNAIPLIKIEYLMMLLLHFDMYPEGISCANATSLH